MSGRKLNQLEIKIHQAALANPDQTLNHKQLEALESDARKRHDAINFLLSISMVRLFQDSKGNTSVRANSKKEIEAKKDMTNDEAIVLNHISAAGNEGIWTKHLKGKTELHQTVIDRCLKSLVQKKLIKPEKSVKYPTRKMYMLYDLDPSVEMTGGPWYTDSELDTEFIKLLSTACLHFVRERSFPKKRSATSDNATLLYPLSALPSYPTAAQVQQCLSKSKVTETPLTIEHIETLLNALVLEGDIEKIPAFGAAMWESSNLADAPDSGSDSDSDAIEKIKRKKSKTKSSKATKIKGKKRKRSVRSDSEESDDEGSNSDDDSKGGNKKNKKRSKSRSKSKSKKKNEDSDNTMSSEEDSDRDSKQRKKKKKKKVVHSDSEVDNDKDSDEESDDDDSSDDDSKKKKRKKKEKTSKSKKKKKSKHASSSDSESESDNSSSSDDSSDDDRRSRSRARSKSKKSGKKERTSSPGVDVGDYASGAYDTGLMSSAYVYRAVKQATFDLGWSQAPCGTCPVFDFCKQGGPTNPGDCEYYGEWLKKGVVKAA